MLVPKAFPHQKVFQMLGLQISEIWLLRLCHPPCVLCQEKRETGLVSVYSAPSSPLWKDDKPEKSTMERCPHLQKGQSSVCIFISCFI